MTITYKDYIMKSDTEGGFHLYKAVTATKKETKEQYDAEITIGYNMSLPTCAKRIAELEMHSKEGMYELKEAVKVWKDKLDEIKKALTYD